MEDGRELPYRWYHRVWDRGRERWRSRDRRRRQAEFERTGTRYYGNGGTIHSSAHLDVEVDTAGKVVAVWFRCQTLPFRQSVAGPERAADMRRLYRNYDVELCGVEVRDPQD